MKAPDEVSPSKITWKKFERTTKQKLTPPLNSSDVWELATSIKERFPVITRPMGWTAAAAAKSLQSCPTLCDPRDGSPLGSPVPGILQARTLEWVAISFSNAWKWKVKVKSLSRVRLIATQGPHSDSSDPMDCSPTGSSIQGIFQAKSTGVGCHCLLHRWCLGSHFET